MWEITHFECDFMTVLYHITNGNDDKRTGSKIKYG